MKNLTNPLKENDLEKFLKTSTVYSEETWEGVSIFETRSGAGYHYNAFDENGAAVKFIDLCGAVMNQYSIGSEKTLSVDIVTKYVESITFMTNEPGLSAEETVRFSRNESGNLVQTYYLYY